MSAAKIYRQEYPDYCLKGIDIAISRSYYKYAEETPTNHLFPSPHNEIACVKVVEYKRLYF